MSNAHFCGVEYLFWNRSQFISWHPSPAFTDRMQRCLLNDKKLWERKCVKMKFVTTGLCHSYKWRVCIIRKMVFLNDIRDLRNWQTICCAPHRMLPNAIVLRLVYRLDVPANRSLRAVHLGTGLHWLCHRSTLIVTIFDDLNFVFLANTFLYPLLP